MSNETLCILLGAGLAGFVQGLSGFAFGLVAIPIWASAVPPQMVGPMAVLGSMLSGLMSIGAARRGFDWSRTWPFIVGGVVGVPIGVRILAYLDPVVFKMAVGCLLLIYCPVLLLLRHPPSISTGGRWADAAIGWIGGVMGGIAGLTGPIPILWCMLRPWTPLMQRSVFQTFNIAMQALALTMYAASGMLTPSVLGDFAIVIPAILLPALVGSRLYHRIDPVAFRRLVLALLIVSGITLLAVSVPALLR
ncbi:MAG: sulfite exporter TauE/SafE family protein [Alphaproteobacteria bacterium]|nr:sulfite exporter TauE/SafE family protein [Alphaproteobacteria bacterium]